MIPRIRIGTDANYQGVYIQPKELFQSIMLLGKPGQGKSNLLLLWFKSLRLFRCAVILLDPSGFLARDAYAAVKGNSSYCSLEHPLSINPMRLPYDPVTICSILREGINQSITVASNQANKDLTVKMCTLVDKAGKECLDKGRNSLLNVRDEIATMRGDGETRDGILARLNYMLSDDRFNEILCGKECLDIQKLTEEGGALILDCSAMNTEQMVMAGNILTQTVKAHLRFSDHSKLKPLVLLIDEARNFVSESWVALLSEGRKYKISVTLASQQMASYPETMRRVLLNCGSLITFRVANQEARYLAAEMKIPVEQIQFLEKYHVHYLTPSITGTVKTDRPPYFKPLPVTKPEPPMPKTEWFTLHPHHPEQTLTSRAVPVEASSGAETVLSVTPDG